MNNCRCKNWLIVVLISFTFLGVIQCRKPLREKSIIFGSRVENPLPFTNPGCTPTSGVVAVKKSGTAFLNFYFNTIQSSGSAGGYKSYELRPSGSGGYYCTIYFVNLRAKTSANYKLIPYYSQQAERTANTVSILGQMSYNSFPGMLESSLGGTVHVEYSDATNKYKITLCDAPMKFTPNSGAAVSIVNSSLQFSGQ